MARMHWDFIADPRKELIIVSVSTMVDLYGITNFAINPKCRSIGLWLSEAKSKRIKRKENVWYKIPYKRKDDDFVVTRDNFNFSVHPQNEIMYVAQSTLLELYQSGLISFQTACLLHSEWISAGKSKRIKRKELKEIISKNKIEKIFGWE